MVFIKSYQKKCNLFSYVYIQINKVPRILILKQSLNALKQCLPQKNLINKMFVNQSCINEFLFQCQNLVDISFILREYIDLKNQGKKIQYNNMIMDTVDTKLVYFLQKEKGNIFNLLKVNKVIDFIEFKQNYPNQIYQQISELQLQSLREEIFIIFNYLIKVWLERRTPRNYYQDLVPMVYWNVIILDDTPEKQQLLLNLTDKIQKYFCAQKRHDGVLNYYKTISFVFDILAINYRKQDPFKMYGLAPLLNVFQNQIKKDQINNWLQGKGRNLKPQQVENIFRNTYHTGSNIFLFNLIRDFSQVLKNRKEFNILYHLYLSYIKKEYLDIMLPNTTYLNSYMDILEFYVIGFINRDRLQGQSQLDKLSTNFTKYLFRKKFNYFKNFQRVIMFYKIYEARFSYLSSVSKKFVSDLQRQYRYFPQLSQIHNKIHQGVFRDAGNPFQDNQYQQLNIKRTDRYRGLMNMGNTCYMNSFMQSLFMTKKFRSAILDIRDQKNLPSSKTLFYALINLFTEMLTKKIGQETQIMPDVFKSQTPEPFKTSWDQHDVAQFGRMYFESLTNQLGDDVTNKQRIEKIFFNKIRKTITCMRCKNSKANIELLFDFILHFKKQDEKIEISKMLVNYFKGQQMSGDNQVYCQRCNKNTDSLAVPQPIRLAEYLIITIGLFEYSGGGKKIKKPFNFEFTINFSKIVGNQNFPDQNYELYAFIVHIGNQSERGHYICYARNLEQNPTIWYCFDDSYVTQRQIQNVSDFMFGQSQTPYLLFYSTNKKRKSLQHASSLNFSSHIISK